MILLYNTTRRRLNFHVDEFISSTSSSKSTNSCSYCNYQVGQIGTCLWQGGYLRCLFTALLIGWQVRAGWHVLYLLLWCRSLRVQFHFHAALNGLFLRGSLSNMQILCFTGNNGSICGNWVDNPPERKSLAMPDILAPPIRSTPPPTLLAKS